jgi:DNA-binding Xre family transcriptional regulator
MSVQVIEKNGKPEWAVVPYKDYQKLVELAEDAEDIRAADAVRAAIVHGEDELVPHDVVMRLCEENPIRVWREYRNLRAAELAEKSGISKAYLAQLEGGARQGTVKMLKRLAEALSVSIDDLV